MDILRRHHALEPAGQRRLELGVQGYQLEQATDEESLRQLWSSIPAKLRADAGLVRVYTDRLMAAGAYERAEKVIRKALDRRWDDRLCERYGLIEDDNPAVRLKRAENWLKDRPKDPGLLLAAGRIAIQARLWGVARRLLEASVGAGPTPEAYRALGALLEKLNEAPDALACYRDGLDALEPPQTAALRTGSSVPDNPSLAAPGAR